MSDSEEEDYTFFGTPLTPYDEDDVPRKKPIRPEDQIATDKQGRRRFHGAFTGGFSAGFYNTVGTPEGWTPAAFKSSRATKAESREQRPEDFMDDEDTDEFGIAPSVLRAKPEYGGGANKRRQEKISFNVGPIPGEPVLRSILEPAKQTIGVLLLMRMGWKPGQGIGPLLTRLQKKMKKQKKKRESQPVKVYGCARGPPEDGGESSESDYDDVPDEINVKALFAPDDVEATFTRPKADKFGMGYSGLDKNHQILSQTRFELFEKEKDTFRLLDNNKKLAIKGQAFGVGAFEEDDEDIYARDDMTRYDFALESAESLRQKRKQEREKAKLLAIAEAASGIVSGFVPAKKAPPRRKFFPRPQIPPDFQPYHSTRKTRFGPEHPHLLELSLNRQRETKKQVITAVDRAAMLGEDSKKGDKAETVLSTKPEEKEKEPEIEEPDKEMMQRLEDDFKKSQKLEEEAAADGQMNDNFRPFMSDPPKQARYERYLHFVKIGAKEAFPAIQPRAMSLWEKDRELAEFEQAAKLYRPLSGMMADRFSRAELPDDVNNPLAPVARSRPSGDADMIAAAQRKTFGKATRRTCEWTPVTLLCKRMNIPEPVTSSGVSLSQVAQDRNTTKAKPKFGVFDFLAEPQSTDKFRKLVLNKRETQEPPPKKVSEEKRVQETHVASIPVPEPARLPSLEPENPPENIPPPPSDTDFEDPAEKRDLFKAIFCSSEEEDNNDDAVDAPAQLSSTTAQSSLSTTNALRNTSPPRGIFANLDLDNLALRKKSEDAVVTEKEENAAVEPDLYGPPLPNKPVFVRPSVTTGKSKKQSSSSSSSSGDEWVEKPMAEKGTDDKKKKKKKKKHRKEEKKKDKKKKKKSKK